MTHHSWKNSFDISSLKSTSFLNRVSAMFLTATFEWATIQTHFPARSHIREAAAIVVVFPVPGGPAGSNQLMDAA